MNVAKKVVVSGRVQGVFFRDTCRRVADELGVSGEAQNLQDGRVEIHLEGESDAVERVIEWCRSGTDYSRVESVEVDDEEPAGRRGFTIE